MTTSTVSASALSANLYPFQSKAQIKAKLENDSDYRRAAMVLLFKLQTEHEQATDSTLLRNRQGFMSSHAVHGSRIARLISSGAEISSEDEARICSIAPRYSRQLAAYFRATEIANNPALAQVASLFSAGTKPAMAATVAPETDETDEA